VTVSRAPDPKLFVSLELSCSTWLVTSLSPGSDKMSKHTVAGGDGAGLLELLERLRAKAEQRGCGAVGVVCVQEAGFEGFWVHRLLTGHGIESHVVDPASVAVPRRQRRAKTDAIDGETLLRTLLAWERGEPRVCAMVVPPSPEEEDERRISRERETLIQERIRHTNRIKGLLRAQGVAEFAPSSTRGAGTAGSGWRRSGPEMVVSCPAICGRRSCVPSSGSRSCCARSRRSRRSATGT
jgi:transposase